MKEFEKHKIKQYKIRIFTLLWLRWQGEEK